MYEIPPVIRGDFCGAIRYNTFMQKATLAGGCFWCTEAIFRRLKGVSEVTPGYAGGKTPNPTYEQVCEGHTGHAEAIQIAFDPAVLPYETLLEIFFHLHDPTTMNRQGNDVGTQYRSVIFFHDEDQKKKAERVIADLEAAKTFRAPIVTQIAPFTQFYEAEDYHKAYFEKNSYKPYCQYVIDPKVQKLLSECREKVKPEFQ